MKKIQPTALLILLLSSCTAKAIEMPQDTVRVTTAWTRHNLDLTGCISRASTVLARENFFVGPNSSTAAHGLKEGITASFRCDYQGVVFIVVAYRDPPDQDTQNRFIEGLRDSFSRG